jgi:predicted kinase
MRKIDESNPKSFYLSDEENEEVFRSSVLNDALKDYDFSPSSKPTVFLSAGLPGAGKTNLIYTAKNSNEKMFIANSDEMRPSHPNYEQAVKLYGSEAGSAVHHDAVIFSDKLIAYALDKRVNFIIDSTLKDPKKTEALLTMLQKHNYHIKVSMIAVNEYESMHGIFNRYVEQYKLYPMTARFVDKRFIDIGKVNIPLSAEIIHHKNIQEFKIFDRNHKLLYDSTKEVEKSVREVMINAINLNRFSPKKIKKLNTSWKSLMMKLEKAKVPPHIMLKAKEIYEELEINFKK